MRFYDLHVLFTPTEKELREVGYSNAYVNAEGIKLFTSDNRQNLLGKLRYYDMIYPVGFSIDPALIRVAQQHGVVIEVPLSFLLEKGGVERGKRMRKLRIFLSFCRKYGVEFVFTSRATTVNEMRTPREIVGIAALLDIPRPAALAAISIVPEKLLSKIKRRERKGANE